MDTQLTDWPPIIEAFGAVRVEGRDNADIMMDYESLQRQLKANLPARAARGVDHLFWKFSGPYKPAPRPAPRKDYEESGECILHVGTRIW